MPRRIEFRGRTFEFPDEATDAQIAEFLRREAASAPHAYIGRRPPLTSAAGMKSFLYSAADVATEGLPAAGATAGALIGGGAGTGAAPGPGTVAGAIGGAGIGGMGGEAARQLLRRALGFEVPETNREIVGSITGEGALQGAIEASGQALRPLGPLLKRAALGQYQRALAPTKEQTKFTARKIAPEMIERGISGSPETIAIEAERRAAGLRPELEAAVARIPGGATHARSPISSTLKALEELKNTHIIGGKVANPEAVQAIEGVQQIVEQYGNNISPRELLALKREFAEAVSKAGGYEGKDLTTRYALEAKAVASSRIRKILHEASPETANLDRDISFWLNVKEVAGEAALRQTGQQGGLLRTLAPLGVGAVGIGTGIQSESAERGIAAGGGTFAIAVLAAAVRSPRWRTISAIKKDRIAQSLASGRFSETVALLGRLGLAAPSALKEDQAADPTEP